MKKQSMLVSVVLSALTNACALAQQPPPARATVWGQHYGGAVVYRYQVQNLGTQPIRRFSIGLFAPEGGEGGPELTVPPMSSPGLSMWLPDQSATRPFGWGVLLSYPEESEKFSLQWIEGSYRKQLSPSASIVENAPLPQPTDQGLQPGSTTTVSAVVESVDSGYTNGHLTVHTGEGFVSVPIVRGDTTPPSIQLDATRVNQNDGRGEWAIFNIKVNVSDDFDPNPEVSVNPVTSNQTISAGDVVWAKNNSAWDVRFRNVANRSYTFSVKAMDASGNEAVRSFVYEVKR